LIIRWPGHVPAGSTSEQLTSLTDVTATCAAIVDTELPEQAAEDSFNMLPVWLGQQGDQAVRPILLQQTISLALSIREGRWKYLDHRGSGGNDYQRNTALQAYQIDDSAPDAPGQLYDLLTDPGETQNLYYRKPEITARLQRKLAETKASGRSRP